MTQPLTRWFWKSVIVVLEVYPRLGQRCQENLGNSQLPNESGKDTTNDWEIPETPKFET